MEPLRTLTLDEAADVLKLHPVTLRRMAIQGVVPATKLGRKWLFLEETLRSLLTPSQPVKRQSKYPDLAPYLAMAGVKE